MQKLPPLCLGVGFFFLVTAVLAGWVIGPLAIKHEIKKNIELSNGSVVWNQWIDPPFKIYFKAYFFNITNPDEFAQGELPKLSELGPYVYEEKRHKDIIGIDPEEDTVSFTMPVNYFFRPDLSNGTEDDLMTIINLPLVGVADRISGYSWIVRKIATTFISQYNEKLFIQRTPREMLFDGYYNKMLDQLQELTGDNVFEGAKVGIMSGRNGTGNGEFEVYRGMKDIKMLNKIKSFNGKQDLDRWPDKKCNMFNGTDGSLRHPYLKKDDIISPFHPDICRSIDAKFKREYTEHGIQTFRFEPVDAVFQSAKTNPDNRCYCLEEDINDCPEDGVFSLAPCWGGSPVTLSKPHFLDAPYYLNKTFGLLPNRTKHEMYFDISPQLGFIFKAGLRIQVNVMIKPTNAIRSFKNLPKMALPIGWIEEEISPTPEAIDLIHSLYILPIKIFGVSKWILLALSCVLIVVGIITQFLRVRRKQMYI